MIVDTSSSSLARAAAVLLGLGLALGPIQSARAQDVKELMGRSQSQAQQKAVEDLIRKLQGGAATKPPPQPVQPPAPPARIEPQARPAQPTTETPQVVISPVEPSLETAPAAKPAQRPDPIFVPTPQPPEPAKAPEVKQAPSAPIAPPKIDTARIDDMPSVDIEVYFDYNSDAITPRAAETLLTLARALADPRLASGRFLIAGHTDAHGGAAFNKQLSERRAASVRRFLVEKAGLAADRLVSRGFGLERPKVPGRPMAVENRRVQIVNLSGREQ